MRHAKHLVRRSFATVALCVAAVASRAACEAQQPTLKQMFDDCGTAPLFRYCHLVEVGVYDAWSWAVTADATLRGAGVRVAILDEGVSCSHESLCGHFATVDGSTAACRASTPPFCARGNGFDFQDCDESADGWDRHSSWYSEHGTKVASMVVGTTPDVGTAPEANILSVRIGGHGIVPDETLARAILWSAEHGADILNFSKVWPDQYPKTRAAIARIAGREYGHGRGVLVIAGTEHQAASVSDYFPGAYAAELSNVLVVTDIELDGKFAYYRQDPAEEHLVAAPGTFIVAATGTSGSYPLQKGSSLSAPLVAGLAADLWGYLPFSQLTAPQLRCAIVEGSKTSGRRAAYGHGAPHPCTASTVPIANLAFVSNAKVSADVLSLCKQQ